MRTARGRRAEAAFDEVGELSTVTLVGDVELTDLGGEGAVRAWGERGTFDGDGDRLELTGIPARMTTPRVEMEAPVLVQRSGEGILHGSGGVRARLEETGRSALDGTPLAEGEGPVWVEAEEGFFREAPRGFLFRGAVRAWRGPDLLTADELRGDDPGGLLTATGDVRTLWAPEEGSAGVGSEGEVEITADELLFRREEDLLIYSGDVVSQQGDRVVSCRELRLLLAPEARAGGGEIETLVCTGDAVLVERSAGSGGRTLRGHRAVYTPGDRIVEVEAAPGGLVTMEDPEGSVVEGPRMIYQIDAQRVQVLPPADAPPGPTADGPTDAPGEGAGDREGSGGAP